MEKTPIPSALQPQANVEVHLPPEKPGRRDCFKCTFYGVLNGHTPICRFEPPKPVGVVVQAKDGLSWMTNSVWPGIIPGQWCGKFSPSDMDS
jgi:hypothetical protein